MEETDNVSYLLLIHIIFWCLNVPYVCRYFDVGMFNLDSVQIPLRYLPRTRPPHPSPQPATAVKSGSIPTTLFKSTIKCKAVISVTPVATMVCLIGIHAMNFSYSDRDTVLSPRFTNSSLKPIYPVLLTNNRSSTYPTYIPNRTLTLPTFIFSSAFF